MFYSIEPSDDGKYIVLKVVGDYTRPIAMKHNEEAHAMGKELGINRYLVDMTESENVETVTENYNFAHKDMINTPGIDQKARVAILASPGDRSHDFVETVANNAGLNVKIFTERKLAIHHLLQD